MVIEKGIQVMISVDGIHYDPKYYKEPMHFMPERFSEERVPFIDRPFLSFGDGPRNCIGQLTFAALLRFTSRKLLIVMKITDIFLTILFKRFISGMRFAKLQTKLGVVFMLRKFKFELSDDHKDKKLEMMPQGLAKLPTMGINLRVSFRDTL